jgi:DNA-binding NarL/FixJ family response regulator
MKTLLVVDGRTLFREGLRLLLSSQSDFAVVGDAGSAASACAAADAQRPEVVILGADGDGIDGAALSDELCRRHPALKVLLLGARSNDVPAAQLFAAIRSVAPGPSHLTAPPAEATRLRGGDGAGPCGMLSRRERDVFEMLVRGHNNRHIAGALGISKKTVETHRAHVLRKLGLHSIVDLIRFAARHQLPLE